MPAVSKPTKCRKCGKTQPTARAARVHCNAQTPTKKKYTATATSRAAAAIAAQRRTFGGGRPAMVRPCPRGCGIELAAREMRRHKCSQAKK
jgi:hypothetical protein